MCEGPSAISGPIPPDPTLVPEYYKRPSSARGRLEGNAQSGSSPLLKGPLAPDPGCYSARCTPRPRIGANAAHILERGQKGVVGDLLKLEGVALNPSPAKPSKIRIYGCIYLIKIPINERHFLMQNKFCFTHVFLLFPIYSYFASLHHFGLNFDRLSSGSSVWSRGSCSGRKRRRNTPDPFVPAGHTQMSERERQETLQSLEDSTSLVSELQSLPVKADTISVRSRRAQLDQRLSEVEEAIKIFSRDKVYVKVDS
uniref:Enkurin domain-containing protein 1-like n=1 Tax=Sinocyclocheilus anshuiensis TaxID=1608454 RepID=A0A671RDF8_9TELE